MGQLVDNEKEKERLLKEIDTVKFEIARSQKMLSNQGFITKAPVELVENEKLKLQNNEDTLKRLLEEYGSLH